MRVRRQIGAVGVTLHLTAMLPSVATTDGAGQQAAATISTPTPHAVTPAPRIDGWWFALQAESIDLMKKGREILTEAIMPEQKRMLGTDGDAASGDGDVQE
ncbi:MAG: hypothetical protein QGH31_02235 [Kiritimatiellia bacterium]|nr:hypothetical protein [Kiritimatiellia bacterium]